MLTLDGYVKGLVVRTHSPHQSQLKLSRNCSDLKLVERLLRDLGDLTKNYPSVDTIKPYLKSYWKTFFNSLGDFCHQIGDFFHWSIKSFFFNLMTHHFGNEENDSSRLVITHREENKRKIFRKCWQFVDDRFRIRFVWEMQLKDFQMKLLKFESKKKEKNYICHEIRDPKW